MPVFNVSANDCDMGEFSASDAESALDSYAKEAGYPSYAALIKEYGDDATATEIDTDALCAAVEKQTGHAVFQDSYGNGVALVNGISYENYQQLARAIGKNSWDFSA